MDNSSLPSLYPRGSTEADRKWRALFICSEEEQQGLQSAPLRSPWRGEGTLPSLSLKPSPPFSVSFRKILALSHSQAPFPSFSCTTQCEKSWGVEPGNKARKIPKSRSEDILAVWCVYSEQHSILNPRGGGAQNW